jgi:hypothetical protein
MRSHACAEAVGKYALIAVGGLDRFVMVDFVSKRNHRNHQRTAIEKAVR